MITCLLPRYEYLVSDHGAMLDKLKTENEHDKFLHMSHFLSINFNTMLNKALLNPHEDSHVHAPAWPAPQLRLNRACIREHSPRPPCAFSLGSCVWCVWRSSSVDS